MWLAHGYFGYTLPLQTRPKWGSQGQSRNSETWEAIAERRNSHGQSRVKHFQASSATDANKSDCVAQAPPASRQKSPEYVYTCPFCNGEVTSSIASGNIDHRHVCGKQFRAENGSLRPTMRYAHTCPTCGTSVHSSREAGRIQSKHKQPNGRACPQTEWQTSWGIRCNFLQRPVFALLVLLVLLLVAVVVVAVAATLFLQRLLLLQNRAQKLPNVPSETLEKQ